MFVGENKNSILFSWKSEIILVLVKKGLLNKANLLLLYHYRTADGCITIITRDPCSIPDGDNHNEKCTLIITHKKLHTKNE